MNQVVKTEALDVIAAASRRAHPVPEHLVKVARPCVWTASHMYGIFARRRRMALFEMCFMAILVLRLGLRVRGVAFGG